MDPLADEYPEFSPYCYVMNNPMLFTDPSGCDTSGGDGTNYVPPPDAIVLDEVVVEGSRIEEPAEPIQQSPVYWPKVVDPMLTGMAVAPEAVLLRQGVVLNRQMGPTGRYYSLSRHANQYTGSTKYLKRLSRRMSRLSATFNFGSLMLDVGELRQVWSGPSVVAKTNATVDFIADLISFHPAGFVGAAAYDLTRAGFDTGILPKPWQW